MSSSHLNCFEPYNKPLENSLTRAFAIMLRGSPIFTAYFYDFVRDKILEELAKDQSKGNGFEIPSFNSCDFSDKRIGIQIGDSSLGGFIANNIVSILLTNEEVEIHRPITSSDRSAIYDCVIHFDEQTVFIMENKPRFENVWEGQLCPSLENQKKDGFSLLPFPVVIAWHDVIKLVLRCLSSGNMSIGGKILANDFLDFVKDYFPYLNPYDRLSLCHDNIELIQARIKDCVKMLLQKEQGDRLGYHKGWGNCITVDLPEIKEIGLLFGTSSNTDDWVLRIALYYADTVGQARAFYDKVNWLAIEDILHKGWKVEGNFHLSHIQTGLIGYETPCDKLQSYFDYWKGHQDQIKQFRKKEVPEFLTKLANDNLIQLNAALKKEWDDKFASTNREKVNVCPGLGISMSIDGNTLEAEDDKGKGDLGEYLQEKINDGLSIVHREKELKKIFELIGDKEKDPEK